MTIKARCGGCGSNFQAKDSLAGKRVKCPKCSKPIMIATPRSPREVAQGGARQGSAAAHNPLLDLLDEVNVKAAVRGPLCPNCSTEMAPTAIVCVSCGFNRETGGQLKTAYFGDDEDTGIADVGMTDADQILAKAEREIEDAPVTAEGQDFGDGADSFVIAGVAGVILLLIVGIGLAVIFTMDVVSQSLASWFISFIASVMLYICMAVWITIVAFMQKPIHGIVCICTAGIWCVVFGFMQGRQLIVPTIVLLSALLIGSGSGAYTLFKGITPDGS